MKFAECDNDRPAPPATESVSRESVSRESVSRESRDEMLRRSAPKPRTSDAEIRRIYEPAPSPELRAAASDAVNEVFVSEMAKRLDLIADAARELGGEVGERIRALAGYGVPTPADATTTKEQPFRITVREHDHPVGDFARQEPRTLGAFEPLPSERDGLRTVTRTGEVIE